MAKQAVLDGDLNQLAQAHAKLDVRVRELDRRAFLTPTEQAELGELKRRKLMVKDRIRASQPPPAPSA